ncbi:uncharacterized protein MYCFIDRAFT_208456 [Pseudocercospora fijiensis CIRAD86]|uniref:Uncharacterized protein n=1 Tax=Pseudocercospora fijiensis (strain CIRAD86) TaxID=383855 RepID=M3ARH1_PSEFD|nr:uncharacterized protein MYCFIDRAFT_208456 [Pseudocercospora fijiensis CIRAD86]EME80037.1 hypothetical protein MYCFIDRAFT_208456 [Pseudocercospora fijiensis CIRAD86]
MTWPRSHGSHHVNYEADRAKYRSAANKQRNSATAVILESSNRRSGRVLYPAYKRTPRATLEAALHSINPCSLDRPFSHLEAHFCLRYSPRRQCLENLTEVVCSRTPLWQILPTTYQEATMTRIIRPLLSGMTIVVAFLNGTTGLPLPPASAPSIAQLYPAGRIAAATGPPTLYLQPGFNAPAGAVIDTNRAPYVATHAEYTFWWKVRTLEQSETHENVELAMVRDTRSNNPGMRDIQPFVRQEIRRLRPFFEGRRTQRSAIPRDFAFPLPPPNWVPPPPVVPFRNPLNPPGPSGFGRNPANVSNPPRPIMHYPPPPPAMHYPPPPPAMHYPPPPPNMHYPPPPPAMHYPPPPPAMYYPPHPPQPPPPARPYIPTPETIERIHWQSSFWDFPSEVAFGLITPLPPSATDFDDPANLWVPLPRRQTMLLHSWLHLLAALENKLVEVLRELAGEAREVRDMLRVSPGKPKRKPCCEKRREAGAVEKWFSQPETDVYSRSVASMTNDAVMVFACKLIDWTIQASRGAANIWNCPATCVSAIDPEQNRKAGDFDVEVEDTGEGLLDNTGGPTVALLSCPLTPSS